MVYVLTMALRFSPYHTLSLLRCLHGASLSYSLRFSTWLLCVLTKFCTGKCGEVPAVRAGLSIFYFLGRRLTLSLWAEPRPITSSSICPTRRLTRWGPPPSQGLLLCIFPPFTESSWGVLDPSWCHLCCCSWLQWRFSCSFGCIKDLLPVFKLVFCENCSI